VTVTLNEAGLTALLVSPLGPVSRYVTRIAEDTAEVARQNVNTLFRTRTGNLYDSIGVFPRENDDGLQVEVGTDGAPYGLVLEQGSDPHTIQAVRFQVMFSEPGHPDPLEHPQRIVNHPGTPPRPWLRPALEQVING
jgi:hypothetical protein